MLFLSFMNPPVVAFLLISGTIFVTKWMFVITGLESDIACAPILNHALSNKKCI